MLLCKEIAVYLNLAACKMKKYTANMLRRANVDLTPEQFLVIDILWNHGQMSQQNVADIMQKDKNSITKLVDALSAKGLVVRQTSATDKRTNILILTPKAEEMKASAKETGISMLDKILEGISESELKGFLSTLDKICANMD